MGKDNKKKSGWNPNPELLKQLLKRSQIKLFNRIFNQYRKQHGPLIAAQKAIGDVYRKDSDHLQYSIGVVIDKLAKDKERFLQREAEKNKIESLEGYEERKKRESFPGPLLRDIGSAIKGVLPTVTGLEQAGRPIAEPIVKGLDQISKLRVPSLRDVESSFLYDDDPWDVFLDEDESPLEFYRRNSLKIHSEDPKVFNQYLRSLSEEEKRKGYGTPEFREKMTALDEQESRLHAERVQAGRVEREKFDAWKRAVSARKRGFSRDPFHQIHHAESSGMGLGGFLAFPSTGVLGRDRHLERVKAKEQLEREGHLDTPAFTATKTGIYPSDPAQPWAVGQRYIDPSKEIEFDENQRISRKYGGSPLEDPGSFDRWRESVTPFFRDKWREERNQKIRDTLGPAPDYSNIDANLKAADVSHDQAKKWFRKQDPLPSLSLQLSPRDERKRQRGADLVVRSQAEKWLKDQDHYGGRVPEGAARYLSNPLMKMFY